MPHKKKKFFVVFLFCCIFFPALSASAGQMQELEPFSKDDRVLILAPHPDDEVIGCAGVIMHALKAGARVKVVYLTNGDNNVFSVLLANPLLAPVKLFFIRKSDFIKLGQKRQQEAVKAMDTLGVGKRDIIFLGYPDYGTGEMFLFHWGRYNPYKGMFTEETSVPYRESKSYKKEFKGDNIFADLKKIIKSYQPTKIFVSHTADFNTDHWALYMYTQVVLGDLLDEMSYQPQVYPYLVHVPDWPKPRDYHPELKMDPPPIDLFDDLTDSIEWKELHLTKDEIEKKHAAMLAYNSQTRVSAFYLLSFVRQNEIFSDLPVITVKKQSSGGKPVKPDGKYEFTSDNDWSGFAVVDKYLLLRIAKPQGWKKKLSLRFFVFGYKQGVYFGDMPNISILTEYKDFDIYDNGFTDEPIDPEDTALEIHPDYMFLKIPLDLLGDPDGILFAFESMKENYLPAGCTAFRKIIIEGRD